MGGRGVALITGIFGSFCFEHADWWKAIFHNRKVVTSISVCRRMRFSPFWSLAAFKVKGFFARHCSPVMFLGQAIFCTSYGRAPIKLGSTMVVDMRLTNDPSGFWRDCNQRIVLVHLVFLTPAANRALREREQSQTTNQIIVCGRSPNYKLACIKFIL